jgi:hypothetical protein
MAVSAAANSRLPGTSTVNKWQRPRAVAVISTGRTIMNQDFDAISQRRRSAGVSDPEALIEAFPGNPGSTGAGNPTGAPYVFFGYMDEDIEGDSLS